MKPNEILSATERLKTEARAQGNDRQAAYAERAIRLLRSAAEKQAMRENRQFASLDSQYAHMSELEEHARQQGNAQGVELAGRARRTILQRMETLLGGPEAIQAALPRRSSRRR